MRQMEFVFVLSPSANDNSWYSSAVTEGHHLVHHRHVGDRNINAKYKHGFLILHISSTCISAALNTALLYIQFRGHIGSRVGVPSGFKVKLMDGPCF